jgi:hypothetical protein
MKTKNWSHKLFLIDLEKRYLWHICDNCKNSLKDSSQCKGQKNKRKVILESPNLPLPNKIKFFILGIHRTTYGHFKMTQKRQIHTKLRSIMLLGCEKAKNNFGRIFRNYRTFIICTPIESPD